MTLVVGCAPGQRGKAVLHLAAMLARSSGDDLVVVTVVPAPWMPGMAKVDAEYHAYLDEQADAALNAARAAMPDGVEATYVRHSARSTPGGLLEVADEHSAPLVVLGSSSAGVFGHVALGSVSDHLLHSSHLPIALAPRGFRTRAGARVTRITAAYGGSEAAGNLVIAAAAVAAREGASLRLASFAVRPRATVSTGVGTHAEAPVQLEWAAMMQDHAEQMLAEAARLPEAPGLTESVVGFGETWTEALDDIPWDDTDVLVVGSSSIGPIARVFLGSRATKLVRHSPVPVVAVPREAAESLAARAGEDSAREG